MSKKIFIVKVLELLGACVGIICAMLVHNLVHVSLFLCGVIAIAFFAGTWTIAYFISRCPDCHMPLHSKSGSYLFEHCPHCGRRL